MENNKLETLLNKTSRYLSLHDFYREDDSFNNAFRRHFEYIRSLGYRVEVQAGSTQTYGITLVNGNHKSDTQYILKHKRK